MPRKELMGWERSQQRWRKYKDGVTYTVSPKALGGTCREDTWHKANDWWRAKLQSLTALDPASAHLQTAVQARGVDGLRELAERGRQAAKLLQVLAAGGDPEGQGLLNDQPIDPDVVPRLLGDVKAEPFTPERAETGLQNLQRLVGNLTSQAVPANRSVCHHIEVWTRQELAAKKSTARKKMNVHFLSFFAKWLGDVEIAVIDEGRWSDYFAWVQGRDWSEDYKGRVLQTARSFVAYLGEMTCDFRVPRNLRSKRLCFVKQKKKIKPVAVEVIRRFFAAAKGQTRLHILLGANCGMTSKDMNDLQDAEVDWAEGAITRKRSKTQKHDDVPEVTYRLWPLTFALLKEYRSGQPTVLLTRTGKPWIQTEYDGKYYRHSDSIRSNFRNLSKAIGVKLTPKQMRTAAASTLAKHKEYKFYAQYFLGQTPTEVADTNYVVPNDDEFFRALDWLRSEFALEEISE